MNRSRTQPSRALLRPGLLLLATFGAVRLSAQVAPPPSTAATPAQSNSPAAATDSRIEHATTDTAIVLSPFEVTTSKEQGYFSPTTLAGTRLNSNIADLPSSITVVTKQQMIDTASVNINDMFMYEANVEGSRSYTVAQIDRNSVHDDLAGYDNGQGGANSAATGPNVNSTRVRGLGTPDIEINNFYSISRAPFDSYNIDSIQIERGPNSIIFGSGSPAGITNASWAQAKINKFDGSLSLQASRWDGFRQTFDVNVPILKDRVAIYLAEMYDSAGMQRKPASDITRRYYGAITIDPFKSHKTKIVASAEIYHAAQNDENSLSPTDFITPWINSGKPIYNELNGTVTYQSTGQTVGPYALATTDVNYVANGGGSKSNLQANLTNSTSPYFVPSLAFTANRPVFFYNNGAFQNAYLAQQTGISAQTGSIYTTPTTFTVAQQAVHAERLTNSTNVPIPANISSGSWSYPGIHDSSLYNWMSGPNIDAPNFSNTSLHTYYAELFQEILPNLNFNVGFFRQEIHQTTQQFVGQVTPVSITIDTNAYLPNGTPNPNVGLPFEQDAQADVFTRPEVNQNWRGSLEYTLDLRKHVPSWLDFLGHHRLMTVFSKHDDWNQTGRWRLEMNSGDTAYLPVQATVGTNPPNNWSLPGNGSGFARWYYLGQPGSPAITKAGDKIGAPGFGSPQNSAVIQTYNYTTGQWQGVPVSLGSDLFFAGTPGNTVNIQDQKTYFWQGYLWQDRIVATWGANHDQVTSRQTAFPANTYQSYIGGYAQPTINYNYGANQYVGGTTKTEGVVVHPFSHWESIDRAADSGNLIAAFGRALGFTFNKSDNFNPPNGFQTDYFGNPLPKPVGNEKDFGVEIATPDNKLYARMTWYKATNENAPISPVESARVLYTDITQLHDWAVDVTQIRDGISNPATDSNFGSTTVYPVSAKQQAEIAALTGLPYTFTFGQTVNGTPASGNNTATATSKGIDFDLVYNPLPNWTIKVTLGKQRTGNSSVEPQALAYVAYRMAGDAKVTGFNPAGLPAWTAYSAPDLPNVITKKDGTPLYLGSFWNGYGYDGNVPYNGTNGGPTTSNLYYQNVVQAPILATTASVGAVVPNEHEYSASLVTNYMITTGKLKNLSFGTGLTYQSAPVVGYYGNADPAHENSAGQLVQPDLNRPIYGPRELHVDLWTAYGFPLPFGNGKYHVKMQFNVRDLTSHGYLLPVTYNYDGTPGAYRIIPPRQYVFNTTFSF